MNNFPVNTKNNSSIGLVTRVLSIGLVVATTTILPEAMAKTIKAHGAVVRTYILGVDHTKRDHVAVNNAVAMVKIAARCKTRQRRTGDSQVSAGLRTFGMYYNNRSTNKQLTRLAKKAMGTADFAPFKRDVNDKSVRVRFSKKISGMTAIVGVCEGNTVLFRTNVQPIAHVFAAVRGKGDCRGDSPCRTSTYPTAFKNTGKTKKKRYRVKVDSRGQVSLGAKIALTAAVASSGGKRNDPPPTPRKKGFAVCSKILSGCAIYEYSK